MNKSLLTNLFSLVFIGIGFLSPFYSDVIITMGLYSFSGALTNWLAVHMLFEKVPLLYGSGVVVERFDEFKQGIRHLMMKQFFTEENLDKFLKKTEKNQVLVNKDRILEAIDFDLVFEKLKSAIMESQFGAAINMFGGEEALAPLKPQFENKLKESFSTILEDKNFLTSLMPSEPQQTSLIIQQISEMIDGRLQELTPQVVKEIIQEMIRRHLGWLVVWGGVFGALIGFLTTLMPF